MPFAPQGQSYAPRTRTGRCFIAVAPPFGVIAHRVAPDGF
jgi:hypothetical protein